MSDFDLDLTKEHNEEHKQLTRELEYLEKLPEVQELERLQRDFRKKII